MTDKKLTNATSVRQKMVGDQHRPGYHYQPPKNWMNDPNGLFQWGGRYHLFYQYNPFGPLWGSIHWGHASSRDLIHWVDHPLALEPELGAGDEKGCWSGCVVDDQGVPTAVYTGFVTEADTPVMLAKAVDPELIRWEKISHNPVISQAPPGVNTTDFRDPYVWQEGQGWKMVVGAGLENGHCAVLLYESHDLISWDYLGHLFDQMVSDTITMWECPNFFPLGDKYVLLVSLFPDFAGVYYYVGDYDGRRFYPQYEGFLESGPIFYAPHARQVDDGRVILFAWLREARSDAAIEKAGWAGVQSLPVELTLNDALKLVSKPVKELQVLRGEKFQLQDVNLPTEDYFELPVRGHQLEIEVEFDLLEGPIGLVVLATDDEAEKTVIGYDPQVGAAFIDTTRSSLDEAELNARYEERLVIDAGESIKIHAFVDGSVLEVWFNDQVRISGRVYPTQADADRVKLFTQDGPARMTSLFTWKMKGIWD